MIYYTVTITGQLYRELDSFVNENEVFTPLGEQTIAVLNMAINHSKNVSNGEFKRDFAHKLSSKLRLVNYLTEKDFDIITEQLLENSNKYKGLRLALDNSGLMNTYEIVNCNFDLFNITVESV